MGDLAAVWVASLPAGETTLPRDPFWEAARRLEPLGVPASSRASFRTWLSECSVPALPADGPRDGPKHERYGFHHFVAYAIRPISEHLQCAPQGVSPAPPWGAVHDATMALVLGELEGVVEDREEHTDFES